MGKKQLNKKPAAELHENIEPPIPLNSDLQLEFAHLLDGEDLLI